MGLYAGRFLTVNLSTRQSSVEPIAEEGVRDYLLGSGFAARLFYDRMNPSVDALHPESPVYVFNGLFTGTMAPTGCKFTVSGRSPLTNVWNESTGGGYWGPELRFAGYDGIVLTGRAERPIYLWVTESGVEFRDATRLWGMDSYETAERIRGETDPKARVIAIGPAGEGLVRLASIVVDGHEARAVGRGGMGAVFGSKNLKAVAVRGGARRPEYYDASGLRAAVREKVKSLQDNLTGFSKLGTAGGLAKAEQSGDLPIKNWLQGSWPEGAAKTTGQTVVETYEVKHYRCFGCPIGCGKLIPAGAGGEYIHAPEYETAGAFGSLCLVDDLSSIIQANELCNRLGLDTISAGAAIAAAMEANERGLLAPELVEGLDLSWGNGDVLPVMVKQMAAKEGLGAWLGEGVRAFCGRLGPAAADIDVTVRGMELPMHDPRAFVSVAANYATANRGACHLEGMTHWRGAGGLKVEGLWWPEPFDPHSSEGKGKMAVVWQNYMATFNPLGLCKFIIRGGTSPKDVCEWLRLALGWEIAPPELLRIGERLFNLKRLINARFGATGRDDSLPVRIRTWARDGGGAAGVLPDQELLLKEYYQERGWDEEGSPTPERLKSLGLP
jgi:aldehyde:ferredoxin oxidoreductase